MTAALLDVNVLVALFGPAHPNHEDAHRWFAVRVLSNPAYPTVTATPGEVIHRLQTLCSSRHHIFWPDDLSLLDATVFRPAFIRGNQKITDACLLALAVSKGGRLATFDRSIPWKAVVGAEPRHLQLLGAALKPPAGES